MQRIVEQLHLGASGVPVPTSYPDDMRVVASPEAVAFVRERGGRLFMLAADERLLLPVTRLDSSTEPKENREFHRVPVEGFELYLPVRMREPEELEIDVRHLPRPHVQGYWNGCVWVV